MYHSQAKEEIVKSNALLISVLVILGWTAPVSADGPEVEVDRVPDGGLQPRIASAADGTVHAIYYRGSAEAGDLFYLRQKPGEAGFSKPLRVNTAPGSAIAMGTIRGAQIAVGRGGRVHIVWNGSKKASPRAPGDATPMLYARLNDAGAAFEPERNLITSKVGLDGGGGVAADADGRVYAFWHAFGPGVETEKNRRIYVARSEDDGETFSKERPAYKKNTGCCACCGIGTIVDSAGKVLVLYRAATDAKERGMILLSSKNQGKSFSARRVDRWALNKCIMSSTTLSPAEEGALAAWENKGQVYFAHVDPKSGKLKKPRGAPGSGPNRKHPVAVANSKGEVLLVWSEGTGWNKGGAITWQVFDAQGKPIQGASGRRDGLPAWSFPAASPRADGGFRILY